MATEQASSASSTLSLDSHDTAICVIPPQHLWPMFDRLRSLYDNAYGKWPPHINLVYPYVRVESLPRASALVASRMSTILKHTFSLGGVNVCLNAVDVFAHRHENTVFLYDNDKERTENLEELRNVVLSALGHAEATNRRMHLTMGQSQSLNASHQFLLEKCSLLPTAEWTVDKLYILIRERVLIDKDAYSQMKIWGTFDLTTFSISRADQPENFDDTEFLTGTLAGPLGAPVNNSSLVNYPYTCSEGGKWIIHQDLSTNTPREADLTSLTIASYNVLAEFDYPPSRVRYPLIIQNILQQETLADVLVLQEVTDDFLSFICQNDDIRRYYRFVSNGPPDQCDIKPLPSHLNNVVFSKWSFSWYWLPFTRRHKGSIIVKFTDIGKRHGSVFIPTILSTVHLTCGLTEGSVLSKKQELQALITHLSENYPQNSWILAGDFNIITSAYTIESALEKKAISSQTITCLKSLEDALTQAGLIDAWKFARVQYGGFIDLDRDPWRQYEIFEGEEGATFDPRVNDLAAETVGSGFNNRPQRYDRILVKGASLLVPTGFTLFGRKPGYLREDIAKSVGDAGSSPKTKPLYASDHWGVRCSLKIVQAGDNMSSKASAILSAPVQLLPASGSLGDLSELRRCLNALDIFPSAEDGMRREAALQLLEEVLLENNVTTARGKPPFVLVPVGSYGLGVWTASSDIDCLCIGPISAKTFFTLATQKIRKADSKDFKLRRRVNAHSGTMLELDVLDIKIDLQYCPSAFIAETWPHVMKLPPTDPVFALPTQTLMKLKPARDMYYIRRTIPDYAVFRTAHHLIRHWAKQRGIYSGKFGLLNGIQISILLSRVYKLVSHEGQSVPLLSLLRTFFKHYANFDWSAQLAFDPFFHQQLRYVRTVKEPMAILGFHPPSLNTALNASLPSVRTISNEFQRADKLLSQEGMAWATFLSKTSGSAEFLSTFKTFVRIDAQFWGVSLAKGSGFVGWLESRCIMLLVDLNRRLPDVHARIWPARFVKEDGSEDETDYQGCYLIGLDKSEKLNAEPISRDSMKTILGTLYAALQKFEDQIRGDEKYFDPNTSWMSASLVNRSELGALRLDTHEWGEYIIGDDEFDDEDEEGAMSDSSDAEHSNLEIRAGKPKSKKKATTASQPTRRPYNGKFRSSVDVMNRIRWDPHMDSSDYVVGYEDRFLGTKERELDQWKSEQTDEEFIPQHRILYFKRRSDGVIVWDRSERWDTVFGSGISSIGPE
ncbi:DUF455 domain-containing protein [Xylaria intraflava]|nr:DUF455 domain-containing protein [Xylaria intraflava]